MIQNTINSAIGLINGAIGLINKIPGVAVGKIGSLSLPRLAKGGILKKSTVIEAGEDGAEAVLPLEKNTEWMDTLAKKISSSLYRSPKQPQTAVKEINNNLGGVNFNIDKFINNDDKDLHAIIGEAMEVAEEYIRRRGGAFA